MKTSQNGVNLIKQFEGCRLTAYKCPAGVWTIGYGHTSGVKQGQSITNAQAELHLKEDLVKFESKVCKYDIYKWNQNEFDALISFAYNIGSIDQLTANGSRNRSEIAKKMLEYNKASGKALSGLTKRRQAEQALFLSHSAPNNIITNTYTQKDFVHDVQSVTGSKQDGIAGSETLRNTVTVSCTINKYHKVVTSLERRLKALGYYSGVIEVDAGKTPCFGPGMEKAVNRYQKEVLKYQRADGEITKGKEMWRALLGM